MKQAGDVRTLLLGTPDFAIPAFDTVLAMGFPVVGVVTQGDKPQGRGYTLTPPPVKVWATEHGLPVFQPKTLRDEAFAALLDELKPDLLVVAAFGKILPANVLDYPACGCINVHGSLLPRWRGAAPMQRAIMAGDTETGITTMMMDVGLDTGDMLDVTRVAIGPDDDFEVVFNNLARAGADTLRVTLQKLLDGTLVRTKQPEGGDTYAQKIEKEDCRLDFSGSAKSLHDQIRGLSPFPLAVTHTPDGKLLKIVASRIYDAEKTTATPGEVLASSEGKLLVATGHGVLEITQVLPEGKGRMPAADFLRGRKLNVGDVLSDC